jgi:drug/metabolite transporter (DMT)-like permease
VRSERGVPLVIAAVLVFSTASPFGKLAAEIPATAVAAGRCAIAALVLVAWSSRTLPSALRAITNKQRGGVVLTGVLLAVHFALFLGGLATTSLSAAVSLVALEPIAVVVAAFLAYRHRPTAREIAGLLVATAGAIVVASGAGVGEHRLAGDLMVLAAVIVFGAYYAAARATRDALPALPNAACVYSVAFLTLLPLALPAAIETPPPSTKALAAVAGLGLLPTLIGHTLVQVGARKISPILVGLISPGEAVGSLAIGAFLMGAAPTTREAIGATLVLAGATLAITSRRDRVE